jgi:phosphate transport system substrate-binding protein
MKKTIALAVLATALVAASATAGVSAVSGSVTADGSSTLGPYTSAAAEGFQKRNRGARVTVGISGTGGGFERFCRNETDLSNASRPMRDAEAIRCRDAGVKWVAFTVANDGLSVVVNRENTWANCLTVAELKKIWEPGSQVSNWSQVRDGFPNVPLKLFGAGTDSGTFDYFTEAINGRARASRSDYLATEDDNIVVQGVSGERGALGYFGYSYYEENKSRLKVLAIDAGKGQGCVTPSIATVQQNKYRPLSRPLFIYAKRTSFKRPVVAAFIGYIFNNEKAIAKSSGFIALTDRQLKKARYQYLQALKANQ